MHRHTLKKTPGTMISSELNRGAAILCLCLLFAAAMAAQEPGTKPTFTTFDAPGAGTGDGQGTMAVSVNAKAAISGFYADPNNLYHGFVRATNGVITTFDAPGAGTGAYQGTFGGFG